MFLHILNDKQKEVFICLAHNVVVSDGELSAGEQSMMRQLCREIGLPDNFAPHYIPLEGIDQIFDTKKSRVTIVIALVRLGYADGAFEIEEQSLLKDICVAFRISDDDFRLIENWVRRLIALEKEASSLM